MKLGAAGLLILASGALAAVPPQFSIIYNFPKSDLGLTNTNLVVGPDGNLYGATPPNDRTIFSVTPSGSHNTIYTYPPPGAFAYPLPGPLTVGADGAFYGVDIASDGSVFRLTADGGFSIIATVPGGFYTMPFLGLLAASDGNLYGIGEDNTGQPTQIYQITLSGNVTLIHALDPNTEGTNVNTLVEGVDGLLYGTTSRGGSAAGNGSFFRMKKDGTLFSVISPFPIASANMTPSGVQLHVNDSVGGLVQSGDGNFYGFGRDVNGVGDMVIFRLTPTGTLTLLRDLAGGIGYGQLDAPMILGLDGNLYGTIQIGDNWTVFQLTNFGALTPIYQGNVNNGSFSGLVQAPDGTFYGESPGGANIPNGYVFRLGPGSGGGSTPIPYIAPALLDAQPAFVTTSSVNSTPSGLVSDLNALAGPGRVVVGAAADGVSRVLLRAGASSTLSYTLTDENMSPIGSSAEYGGLAQVTGPGTPYSNSVPIQPSAVNGRALAFVAYRAPMDFVRADPNFNASDQMANTRTVNIQVSTNDGTVVSNYPITLVRPPVVVIHGITSEPKFWSAFTPLVTNCAAPTVSGDARFYVQCADWSKKVPNVVSINPNYLGVGPLLLAFQPVRQNVLGYAYNAPVIFSQMQNTAANYSLAAPPAGNMPVASAQVDAVGHSMGNEIARTIPYVLTASPNSYLQTANYGQGVMHKLISVAGPHLGSPMAIVALDPANACTWIGVAAKGEYPLNSALIAGDFAPVSGGTLDLVGDGQGNCVSPALNVLQGSADKQIPTALIAGEMSDSQLNGLNNSLQALAVKLLWSVPAVKLACGSDYAFPDYNAAGWLTLMKTTAANQSDAFVPVTSALDGLTASGSCVVQGGQTPATPPCNQTLIQYAVHGPGTVSEIGFPPPEMLQAATPVPMVAINLLNAKVSSAAFTSLPSYAIKQVGGCK